MERERGQVPPNNQEPNSQSKSHPHEQPQQGRPEGNPLAPHTPQSSEHDPDSVLSKLQQREYKRLFRPVNLYDTPLMKEEIRRFEEQYLADTPEAQTRRQDCVARLQKIYYRAKEIRETARADLTPHEQEQLKIEDMIFELKRMRGMSRKINHVEELFRADEEFFYELFLPEPEFTGPIARGWIKRGLRLEKAMRKIERIHQSRGEEPPQERRVNTKILLERLFRKHAEDQSQER